MRNNTINDSIPISISLQPVLEEENIHKKRVHNKGRIITISLLTISTAVCISFIARFLILLINLITNLSFYGAFSLSPSTPAGNTLGIWVVIVPLTGGLIVGL